MRAPVALVLLILGGLGTAPVMSAQRHSVNILISAAGYCREVYIPRSDLGHVYLRGEPIRMKVTLANQDNVETTLRFPESPGLALVPQRSAELKLGPFENARVLHAAGFESIQWPRELRLDVGARFEFDAEVHGPDMPGEYVVTFDSGIVDSSNRPPAPQANRFAFEVVHSSPGFAAEQALRRACHSFRENDEESASQAVRSLLEVHPNSYVAYSLRGRLAERKGDFNEARISYERAATILEAGLDRLYLDALGGARESHPPTPEEFRRRAASLVR